MSEDIWLLRLFGDQMKSFDDYIRFSRNLKTIVGPLAVDLLNTGQIGACTALGDRHGRDLSEADCKAQPRTTGGFPLLDGGGLHLRVVLLPHARRE